MQTAVKGSGWCLPAPRVSSPRELGLFGGQSLPRATR